MPASTGTEKGMYGFLACTAEGFMTRTVAAYSTLLYDPQHFIAFHHRKCVEVVLLE